MHLKGEALFDVRPDAEKPFIVKVEDYDVKVLGTVFNVKSYPGIKAVETSLLSSKVEIQLANQKSAFKVLHPKEKFVIDKAAAAPSPGEATAADGLESDRAANRRPPVKLQPEPGERGKRPGPKTGWL